MCCGVAHQGDVSEEKVLVRTQTLPDWVRPKSKSTVKASSLADQERNKKELRMLDHDEVRFAEVVGGGERERA